MQRISRHSSGPCSLSRSVPSPSGSSRSSPPTSPADGTWPARAFIFVYVLFFTTGMAYALIARRMGVWSYEVPVALALLAGFDLAWFTRVHVAGSETFP